MSVGLGPTIGNHEIQKNGFSQFRKFQKTRKTLYFQSLKCIRRHLSLNYSATVVDDMVSLKTAPLLKAGGIVAATKKHLEDPVHLRRPQKHHDVRIGLARIATGYESSCSLAEVSLPDEHKDTFGESTTGGKQSRRLMEEDMESRSLRRPN